MLSSSIDLSSLPDALADQVRFTIDQYEKKHLAETSWPYVLEHGTDEQIMQKAREECLEGAPLVFARDYPQTAAERCYHIREVVPYPYTSHPRRPIIMRGARLVRYWKHSFSPGRINPNGWAYEVFLRALRRTKKTLVDPQEINAFIEQLATAVATKHTGLTAHYWQRCQPKQWLYGTDLRLILMNGRLKCVPQDQFVGIERIFNIIRKTDKLEERLRLARESKRY